MRTSLYAFAAVAMLVATVPASAQVGVRVGEDGVGVRVGRDHSGERYRDRGWREGRRDHCRTIIEKHRTPGGNLVIRKTRRCD